MSFNSADTVSLFDGFLCGSRVTAFGLTQLFALGRKQPFPRNPLTQWYLEQPRVPRFDQVGEPSDTRTGKAAL
jgi:hypothetical protein